MFVRDEVKVKLAAGALVKNAVVLCQSLEITYTMLCNGNSIETICTASCMSVTSVTLLCP